MTAQPGILTQFHGTGQVISVSGSAPNWTLRIANWNGGYDYPSNANYDFSDMQTGDIVFVNCNALEITSITPVIINSVYDVVVDSNYPLLVPPAFVYAGIFRFSANLTLPLLPRIAVDAGLPGMSPEDRQCLINWLINEIDQFNFSGSDPIISAEGTPVGQRPEINFIEGTGITIGIVDNGVDDRIDVTLNATGAGGGETNTVSNIGAGVGIFKQKTGVDFELYTLDPVSGAITIVLDAGNNTIDFDVDETQIDHNNLLNYVAGQHVDHSAVSVIAGVGIGGGGDLTASRTFNLNFQELALVTDIDDGFDQFVLLDTDGNIHERISAENARNWLNTWLQTELDAGSVIIDGNTNNLSFTNIGNFAVVTDGSLSLTKNGTTGLAQIVVPDDLFQIMGEAVNVSGDTSVNIVTVDGNIDIDAFGSGRTLSLDAGSSISVFEAYNLAKGIPGAGTVMLWPDPASPVFIDLDSAILATATWLKPELEGGNDVEIAGTDVSLSVYLEDGITGDYVVWASAGGDGFTIESETGDELDGGFMGIEPGNIYFDAYTNDISEGGRFEMSNEGFEWVTYPDETVKFSLKDGTATFLTDSLIVANNLYLTDYGVEVDVVDEFVLTTDEDGNVGNIPIGDFGGGSADGNGIYSGSDTLPGIVQVEILEDDWLQFNMNTGGGTEDQTAIRITTPFSSDSPVSYYLKGVSPTDSLLISAYDNGSVILADGGPLTVGSTANLLLSGVTGTSIQLFVNVDPDGLFQPRAASTTTRDTWTLDGFDEGRLFYNTDSTNYQFWDGSAWQNFGSGGAGDNLGNHTATQNIQLQGNWLSYNGSDKGIYPHLDGGIAFDTTTITPPLYAPGNVYWDIDDRTLAIQQGVDDVVLQVGQENYIRVRNTTGSTITNGRAVYISGVSSNRPNISLAQADDPATSDVVGLATHDIEHNTDGLITTFGLVNDVNTAAFAAGDTLYLSASVAGGLTNVAPSSPNSVVRIGRVTVSHASQGAVLLQLSGTTSTDTWLKPELEAADVTIASGLNTLTFEANVPGGQAFSTIRIEADSSSDDRVFSPFEFIGPRDSLKILHFDDGIQLRHFNNPGNGSSIFTIIGDNLVLQSDSMAIDFQSGVMNDLRSTKAGWKYNGNYRAGMTTDEHIPDIGKVREIVGDSVEQNTFPLIAFTADGTDTIDWNSQTTGIARIDFSSVTSSTLTITGGDTPRVPIYTAHLYNITDDTITFPSNLLNENGEAFGQRRLTSGDIFSAYYDGTNYWTDAILGDTIDATVFDSISNVSGLILYTHADSAGLSNGAALTSWNDLSGTGNTVTQDTASRKPLYASNVLNGRGGIDFDGSNDRLWSGAYNLTNDSMTIAVVVSIDEMIVASRMYYLSKFNATALGKAQFFAAIDTDTTWRATAYNGASSSAYNTATTANEGTGYIVIMRIDAANDLCEFKVNGVDSTDSTGAGISDMQNSSEQFTVGSRGPDPGGLFNGKMCVLAVWSKYLSDDEANSVSNYLNDQYSTY